MELVFKAIPVKTSPDQHHKTYLASFLFADIVQLIKENRLYVPNHPDLSDFAQRKPNPIRITQISTYILESYITGTIFFPPICINIHPQPDYEKGKITLPYHNINLRLTDGQHRCLGIHRAIQTLEKIDPDQAKILSQLEIGALLYAALPLEQERQAFRDQNLLVQRPSTSLAHYFDQRSPHVLIAKHLMVTVSQFQDNVEMIESGLGKYNPKLLTLSTLVTATKFMFPHLQATSNLENFKQWASQFWQQAAQSFADDPWQPTTIEIRHHQRKNTIHTSSVLFQALGLIAHDLYKTPVTPQELRQYLRNLNKLDWQKNNHFWLDRGVTQLGTKEIPIISNTRNTVNLCHQTLRDCLGITLLVQ